MGALAAELFREVTPEFFRVLAGPNAAIYIDILNALEQEATQNTDGLSREAALDILTEILARHPDFQLDGGEPSGLDSQLPVRDKARLALDRLAKAGWLKAQTSTEWQKTVFFDEHGVTLLGALRKIARPDAAVFTDKLIAVCAALVNRTEMARNPWEHVKACEGNTRQGLSELRGMRKSVERLIRRQLEAKTMGENLNIVFDQYAEQIGHTCYAELVRSQLPGRLGEARDCLQQILEDTELLHRMQTEVLRRDPEADATGAIVKVRNELHELSHALDSVVPLADAIDTRTAEFTRRSHARFRYLQQVVGERREQMKELFQKLNTALAGRRFGDLEKVPALPPPPLPDARLPAGRDSLYEPPRRRVLEENPPLEDEAGENLRERTRLQMESALRDSLGVTRANRFVGRLPGGKGARIAAADLPVSNEDDLNDLIAVLLHGESSEAGYRVEVPRVEQVADEIARDRKAGCQLDRFYIIKK